MPGGTVDDNMAASADRGPPDQDQALERRLPSLAGFLRDQGVITRSDPVSILTRFTAGQSNPTYLLSAGGKRLVLRKQPDGQLLPKAHDVAREFRIMSALHDARFAVPHPRAMSEDRDIVGTAFYVMDYVPGTVHSNPALPETAPADRARIYDGIVATLAQLHQIDPAVLAPARIQPRGDFVARQITIWRSAYLAAQTTTDDRIEAVAARLLDQRPQDEVIAIVHGDYRIENLIFDGTRPVAVLDWELCSTGEPRCDLAYCCLWHHFPSDVLSGLADLDLTSLGIPEESALLDRYAELGGPAPHSTHRYFLALGFYRLAAILQGVYRRALEGNAASPDALRRGKIADYCLREAEKLID